MANILADLQDGSDYITGVAKGITRRRAGAKLATGDYQGASSDLYGAGMLTEGRGARREGEHLEDRATTEADHDREIQLADAKERATFMKQVTTGLTQVSADKRGEAFEHVVPTFEAMGIPADIIEKMRAAPKDDATLAAFGATIDDQLKLFSTKDGIVSVGPDGQAKLAYKVEPDPLDVEYKRAQIAATRSRAGASDASAAKARRSLTTTPTYPGAHGKVLGATLNPNDGW